MNAAAALAKCFAGLPTDGKKATVFLSEKLVVSVCRRHKFRKRQTREDFVIKVGQPNFIEREFIKRCKRDGVALPTRVQVKSWPVKKKA